MRHPTLGDEQFDPAGKRDGFHRFVAAIKEDGVTRFAEGGGDLVEKPAVDAHKLVLGAATELGDRQAVQAEAEKFLQQHGGGNFQRGGTRKPCAQREAALDFGAEAAHGQPGLLKHIQHPQQVVGPFMLPAGN